MPLYEYACQKCRKEFELLIRTNETPECPHCGSRKLEKQLSVPAAHMAGSNSLPVCDFAPPGGCGSSACGSGHCPLG